MAASVLIDKGSGTTLIISKHDGVGKLQPTAFIRGNRKMLEPALQGSAGR